jgi:signal transduction histidine kinase
MHEEASGPKAARNAKELRIEELRSLLARVDAAHEVQRERLARELHHKIVGSLSAAKMECDWLLRRERADDALRPRLQRLSDELDETIQYARHLIGELWPAIVGHLGLASAMQQEIADVRSRCAASIDLDIEGDVDGIGEASAIALYRLTQQVLAGCATDPPQLRGARIALRRTDGNVELHIELDAALAWDDAWFLLEERVAHLGGQLTRDETRPGSTLVYVVLPAAA